MILTPTNNTMNKKDIDYTIGIVREINNLWKQKAIKNYPTHQEETEYSEERLEKEIAECGIKEVTPKNGTKEDYRIIFVYLKDGTVKGYSLTFIQYKLYKDMMRHYLGI